VPTLQKIIQLMGEDFSEQEIRAAVEWGSFDNLQKLETSGTFSQGGMKLVNPDDPSTFKVRRGKVGATARISRAAGGGARALRKNKLGYCCQTGV
jgi:hypothetical protein